MTTTPSQRALELLAAEYERDGMPGVAMSIRHPEFKAQLSIEIRRSLRAIEAALRLPAGEGWQPIATAPKCAGRYLVTNGNDVREARWQPRLGNWVFPSAQSGIRYLTHWMPLPAAPRHETGE